MAAEGAAVIDVGGESSRPRAEPVPEAEELDRVVPVIRELAAELAARHPGVRVSVDTVKPAVARAAVGAGASIVNDISAGLHGVAAETGAGWVAMHMRGTPATMQDDPTYDDVVADVLAFLEKRVTAGAAAGVEEIWVDPGIGFGKTARHNLALLSELPRLRALGRPLLVGVSRKSFLGAIAHDPGGDALPVDDRLEPSLAAAVWAMENGADMVRVHDVAPTLMASRLISEPVAVATEPRP
jgi:dihydropteroate synthase